ncbi:MAG TPA: hypothetical protein DF715_01905 [Oceanicaulis sp.]|nr:hypothetical protein [Oceanicaulis sp.]
MHRILIAVLAVLWVSAAGHAIAPSVMEPYRAYMAAIESDDLEDATTHAEAAYQAGVAAQIDADTLAVLAENRAQIYTDTGDHRRAASAWNDLAGVLERAGADVDARARVHVLAASQELAAGQRRNALNRAGQALELFPEGSASSIVFEALLIQATAEWQSQRVRSAGPPAVRALDVFGAIEAQPTTSLIQLLVFAGSYYALVREPSESAFYLSLAADYAELFLGRGDRYAIELGTWANYVRRGLDDAQREALFNRQVQSPLYLADIARPAQDEVEPEPRPAGWVDASPSNRIPPTYPSAMLHADLEGVAVVQFSVLENGRTGNINVLFSVPHQEFGRAARRAVQQWRYTPATVDGVPVVRDGVHTQFEFNLRD